MGAYLIGEIVKQTRESLDISQEELCDGICSVETLSRIETGKSAPSRVNFEALMERMGKCGKKYLPFVRHTDMETHLMREEIHRDISQFRYAEAGEVLRQLEERLNADDPVNHQYVLRYRALVDFKLGKISLSEKRSQLAEALHCTVPRYEKIDVLPKGIFNETEPVPIL